MELTKDDRLKELGITGADLPEEAIMFLYKNRHKWMKKEEKKEDKLKDIDKTTDKYKLILKLINRIMKNIGKEEIKDLREFKDIDRLDLIKDEHREVLIEMEKELFKYFDKTVCGWYRKDTVTRFVITCLSVMCEDIGLKLVCNKKDITEYKDNKGYRRTHYFFTIK